MATTQASINYPDHGTVMPARETTADTVPGQILELAYYLMQKYPDRCQVDPDFISKKILLTIELPLKRSIEGAIIEVTTSDIYPLTSGDLPNIGSGG